MVNFIKDFFDVLESERMFGYLSNFKEQWLPRLKPPEKLVQKL